jgi:hypothetical protein
MIVVCVPMFSLLLIIVGIAGLLADALLPAVLNQTWLRAQCV